MPETVGAPIAAEENQELLLKPDSTDQSPTGRVNDLMKRGSLSYIPYGTLYAKVRGQSTEILCHFLRFDPPTAVLCIEVQGLKIYKP